MRSSRRIASMKIAVLGTGDVGRRIASKLVELGHEVCMGSRSADHEGGLAWVAEAGERASLQTFADAAAHGEIVFNCASGKHTLAILQSAGASNLAGKVLVDVANPLDFSNGFPPTLTVCNDDSLAEQIQRAHPEAKVVKALNTMANPVMVAPRSLPGTHQTFVCGNDEGAKAKVAEILQSFGWKAEEILDLGDVTVARGLEMWLPLWVRLYSKLGTGEFNVQLVRAT